MKRQKFKNCPIKTGHYGEVRVSHHRANSEDCFLLEGVNTPKNTFPNIKQLVSMVKKSGARRRKYCNKWSIPVKDAKNIVELLNVAKNYSYLPKTQRIKLSLTYRSFMFLVNSFWKLIKATFTITTKIIGKCIAMLEAILLELCDDREKSYKPSLSRSDIYVGARGFGASKSFSAWLSL